MSSCNDCQERVTNCGPISYAMCVRYEGSVRIGSPLENFCELSVQDVIEDLYSLIEDSSNIYYNGDGILLNNNTFSLDYSKVRSANWKPTWEDIQGDKPEQVNLIEGDNIKIEGIYPNLTVSSEIESGVRTISVEGVPQSEVLGNVDLKRATYQNFGVVKLGANITLDSNGNIIAPEYDRGLGLQKINNVFSIGFETSGSGNVVGNIERTESGLKVTYTNATGSDYVLPDASTTTKGGVKLATNILQSIAPSATTSVDNKTYAIQKDANGALVVNIPWTDSNTEYNLATDSVSGLIRLGSNVQQEVPIVPPSAMAGKTYPVQLTGAGRAVVNVPWVGGITYNQATIDEPGLIKIGNSATATSIVESPTTMNNRTYPIQLNSSGQAVVNVPWTGGGSYIEGNGITISGNTITNSSPNATHTGEVTGATALTITNNVVSNAKLSQMPTQTIKGNIGGGSSTPQDIQIDSLKDVMQLGCKHILLDTLTSAVDTESFHQTSVFCNNSVMGSYSIAVQDGSFDGQQLYLQFSAWTVDARGEVELTGNLINFNIDTEADVVNSLIKVNASDIFLFWSVERGAWMTRLNKVR